LDKTVEEHWQFFEKKDVPIRIAVLDSGCDLEHADFKQARAKTFSGPRRNTPKPAEYEIAQEKRIIAYQNFCPDQKPTDISDIDGHGTQVAGLILRLAPHTHVYIARVCSGDANRGLPPEQRVRVDENDFCQPQPETVKEVIN
jgi:hypothetical protein